MQVLVADSHGPGGHESGKQLVPTSVTVNVPASRVTLQSTVAVPQLHRHSPCNAKLSG
jgi:hypothetical protein